MRISDWSSDVCSSDLRLKAWPTAHTNTDLTVHDEKTGTLWASDLLFERRLPTLDGSLLGWLTVLDSLLADDVRRGIPGHGAVSDGRAAVAAQRPYLARLPDAVRHALADDLAITPTLAPPETGDQTHGQVAEKLPAHK